MAALTLRFMITLLFTSALLNQGAVALSFSIVENGGVNQFVGQVATNGEFYRFEGLAVAASICNTYFNIDSAGMITTNGSIDREQVEDTAGTDILVCIVTYIDQSSAAPQHETVTITILDVNDNEPRFFELSQPDIRSISENVQVPTPILRLEPVDKDKGRNGTTTFEITSGNEQRNFIIQRALGDRENSTTRILFLQSMLDFDQTNTQKLFNLTITIHDMGEAESLSYEQVITINVLNLQDEPPTFAVTSVSCRIPENHPVGTRYPFANITASNTAEVQGDIFYSLTPVANSEYVIGVNELNGEVYLNQSLDFEISQKSIQFYVNAFNPSINAGDEVFVTLDIDDVNDNHPKFPQDTTNLILVENHSIPLLIAEFFLRDGDASIVFKRLDSNTDIITSDPSITELYTEVDNLGSSFFSVRLFLNESLDREVTANVTIELTAYNLAEPRLSDTTTIHINVLDINDNTPQFQQDNYILRIAEGAPVGREIVTIEAFDDDEGQNGTITYAIVDIDNPQAQGWFYLSPTNGTLSIASADVDFNIVSGRVRLNVSATDNGDDPHSNSTTIDIEISPTITFSPSSYVEYNQFDVLNSEKYSIYLEFRTKRSEGVIFFQQGEAGDYVVLEIQDGHLSYQHGPNRITNNESIVTDDKWYSVLVEGPNELRLQVWDTLLEDDLVAETLLGATLLRCVDSTSTQTNSLYIGGVNLFSLDDDANLASTEFIGTIRNVLINNTQIDLGCPINEVNIIPGFHYSNACDAEQTAFCENTHTSGCVDFAPEPYCKCLGGFPPQSCQPIPNPDPNIQGGDDSYAPIRFHGNSKADIELDYSFFSDLEIQKRKTAQEATLPVRRKRANTGRSNRTVQTIEVTFRPVDVDSSVLLYSVTPTAIHKLQISEASEEVHAIIYMVIDQATNTDTMHIALQRRLQNMTVYNVTVTISEDMATLSIESNGVSTNNFRMWGSNDYSAFVEQPSTTLSIGGGQSSNQDLDPGYFQGCISRVAIDSIELPLSGLLALSPEEGGFMAGNNKTRRPDMYCDLCDLTTCQDNAECVRDVIGEPICACQDGFIPIGSQCGVLPTIVVTGPVIPEVNDPTIPYIIGGSVGAAALIMLIVLVVVFSRVCHKKRDRQKRTYSVSNMNADIPEGHSPSSRPNAYVHVQPRRDDSGMTTLDTNNSTPRHDRGSSVSTYQEHAEDGDPEIETPCRYSRRKSTISAESGIKTDTDQEPSLRSIPRMEDSGNEKDTDYSDGDSASDDLSSTCFMQAALSPVNIQLIGSSNSLTAMHSTVSSPHTPLTPKERQMITPLRPPSTSLSVSEIEDNRGRGDEDTDVETAFPYNHTLPSLSRNSSTRQSGRRDSGSGDTSRVSSSCSGSKWYKASTASDTEREKERSRANRAYYAQRSEPARYQFPPEYQPPPSFEHKKQTPMAYPNTRRSRAPIAMHIADSPLTRNNKYENYQLPYADEPVRDPRLRYDNHRLRQQHSLPKGYPYDSALSSASSSTARPKHNAAAMLASAYTPPPSHDLTSYPRHYNTMGAGSTIPHHSMNYQHSRSYSSEDKSRQEPEQQFQDLKSVATINPIAYWEMQDRMKTAVDQVDPYQILSEPYIQFEDVSTDPSVIESQITQDQDGPEHQSFCSQGGGEGTADVLDPINLSLSQLQDNIYSSTVTGTEPVSRPRDRILHFPSADCSSQYTATLVASSSTTSGSSTPKTPNVFAIPSQHQFDV